MVHRVVAVLAGVTYTSKSAIEERARGIREAWRPGGRIDGADAAFLGDLLKLHPAAAQKMGCGVSHFTIALDPFGSRSQRVHRTDGSATLFSTKGCLTESSGWTRYCAAARHAVRDQIISFKMGAYGRGVLEELDTVPCAVSGVSVKWYDAHVDHDRPTFSAIVTDFDPKAWWTESIVTVEGGHGDAFADEWYALRWAAFHKKHAKLRIVTSAVNAELARQERLKGNG